MDRSFLFEGKSKERMVSTCQSHSGVILKNSERNNFPLGRTVCSAPDNPLYVEERGTEDKNLCRILAVTNGFTVKSWD